MKYGIDAQYRLALFDAEPEQAIASDVWFAALTAVLGVAAAVAVVLRVRRRPGASVGGLLLGTSLAAFVVLGVGALLRPGDLGAAVTAQPQAVLEDALVLRAQGFLVAGPIAAMVAWTVLDLLRSALGREPVPSIDEPLAAPDPEAHADVAPEVVEAPGAPPQVDRPPGHVHVLPSGGSRPLS
jgi:hypothetical protein